MENAEINEALDEIFVKIQRLEKSKDDLTNRIDAALDFIYNRLDALENKSKTIATNQSDVSAVIDEYLSLYDAILSKVSEKYKTMDIHLKKNIATTIFIRLMQK